MSSNRGLAQAQALALASVPSAHLVLPCPGDAQRDGGGSSREGPAPRPGKTKSAGDPPGLAAMRSICEVETLGPPNPASGAALLLLHDGDEMKCARVVSPFLGTGTTTSSESSGCSAASLQACRPTTSTPRPRHWEIGPDAHMWTSRTGQDRTVHFADRWGVRED